MSIDIADISTRIYDMPVAIRSFVKEGCVGEYTIIINARLNNVERMKAYKHELGHILGNDFDKNDVQEIEAEAHA